MQMGKLYGNNDMVKIDCHDCKGCSSCCRDMGQSIWLDPYDIYQMTIQLKKTFEELLSQEIELHVEEGLILPNIRMVGEGEPKCSFLNAAGRCEIHAVRPGFCRLFPLGRNYESGKLTYFILDDACPAPLKSKIKINKWLSVPRIKEYEAFLIEWHGLTKKLRETYAANIDNEAIIKAINMQFLQIFYIAPYNEEDFYLQFAERFEKMRTFLQTIGI